MCKKKLQLIICLLGIVPTVLHAPPKQQALKSAAKGLTTAKAKKLSREQEEDALLEQAQKAAESAQAKNNVNLHLKLNDKDFFDFKHLMMGISSLKNEDTSHLGLITEMLKNRKIINYSSKEFWNMTLLMMAVMKNLKAISLILLNAGADPNLQKNDGATALILAAQEGYKEIVTILLEHGANPNLKKNEGSTALMFAAQEDHQDILDLLLHKNADPNLQMNDGNTALILAARKCCKNIIAILLKNGANPNLQMNDGITALMYAANNNHKDILQMLLSNGADLNMQNKHGDTGLMYAAENDHIDIVKILLENGANPHLKNKDGKMAIALAKEQGFTDIAKIIEKYQLVYDVKQKNEEKLLQTSYQKWKERAKNSIVEKNKEKLLVAEEKSRRKFLNEEQQAIDDMLILEKQEWDNADPIIKLRKDLVKISDWQDEWDEKSFQDARKYQGLE